MRVEKCLLSDNIYDYVNVSQGKITIANVDDGEECTWTDVSSLIPSARKISPVKSKAPSQLPLSQPFP